MSEKVYDNRGRWRSKTIAFRMSEAENDRLNMLVSLSGKTKQDYIIHKLLNKDVVIYGNPRIFKALKDLMIEINDNLVKIAPSGSPSPELLETINTVSKYLAWLATGKRPP